MLAIRSFSAEFHKKKFVISLLAMESLKNLQNEYLLLVYSYRQACVKRDERSSSRAIYYKDEPQPKLLQK